MQLPEGWHSNSLGELCTLINRGIAPKYLDNDGTLVLNQKCIRDHQINYTLARQHNHLEKKVPIDRFIQLGDGLINSTGTGTLGRVAQVRVPPPEPTTVDTHVTIVRPKAGIFFQDFFGYMLVNIENKLTKSGEGASGQTELSRHKLANDFLVSYPKSQIEQKRIVAILDEAFAGISQAIANTEKNLANVWELFERYVELKFSLDLRNEKTLKLGELSEVKSGGTPSKAKPTYWNGKFAWYSSGELNQLETIEPENYITLEGLDNSNAKIFPKGSLLIGMYDTAALKMSILDRDAAFNQAISGMKPCERVDLIFVMYAIRAIKENVLNLRRGVRQKNLSLQKIKDISIPVPTRQKQDELIKNLKDLIQVTGRQMNLYQQKLQSLAELKQSLLQKAFSGELTANNVDKWVNP